VRSVTVGPHRAAQATDFAQGRIGLQAREWHRAVTTPLGELRAQLRQQQVVLISDPAGDQERIDEHPEESDQHPYDCQRQNELCDRDASALEIEVVGSEQPQEKSQYIGDERSLLVGLEQHQRAGIARQAAVLRNGLPRAWGKLSLHDPLLAPPDERTMVP